jgi:transcriptional regulator
MYIPKHFEETSLPVLHALLRAHPLATWVTRSGGEPAGALDADHVPLLLDASRGELGTLVGHVARANPVWKSLAGAADSLVIFQGAEAYITPSWYPSKRVHGKAVPTWNYAVVHVRGTARAIQDRDWLLRHVTQLTGAHEAQLTAPWQVADAPADYIEQMLRAIVGIEIAITDIVGKWKVSQNRSQEDRFGVVAGLAEQNTERSKAMASLVELYSGVERD